jgi:hypothetical protein
VLGGTSVGAYALSSAPDTARSTLVGSAIPLILGASALLSLAGIVLRHTPSARWLTQLNAQAWTITAAALVTTVLMVGVAAHAWSDGGGWTILPATLALTASLTTLGVRHGLFPIAVALALCGVLAEVAATLPA